MAVRHSVLDELIPLRDKSCSFSEVARFHFHQRFPCTVTASVLYPLFIRGAAWLRRQESNLRPSDNESDELPLLHSAMCFLISRQPMVVWPNAFDMMLVTALSIRTRLRLHASEIHRTHVSMLHY